MELKKNLNASKPSEHPQVSEGLGGNIGCRDKTSSWYQKGSSMYLHRVDSILPGRSPPLYYTLLGLISMQGHQNHDPFYVRVLDYSVVIWSYMDLERLKLNLVDISIVYR